MVIKQSVDSLEGIDEKYHDLYVEADGTFSLDVELNEGTGDISEQSGKLKEMRKRANDLQKRLGELDKWEGIDHNFARSMTDQFEGLEPDAIRATFDKFTDLDPDEAREAIEKIKNSDMNDDDMKAEIQRKLKQQKEQMMTDHKEKLGAAESENVTLLGKYQNMLKDNAGIKAIKSLNGDIDLLLPHVRPRLAVIENNGKDIVVALDDDGQPDYADDGDYANAEFFVKKNLVTRFPTAFKGAASSGGGGAGGNGENKPGSGGTKEMNMSEFEALPEADKQKFMLNEDGTKRTDTKLVND